jgi:hypothetical protein
MLKINAIFQRKVAALETKPCVIETVNVMSNEEYEEFTSALLMDKSFIAYRKEDMFTDSSGQVHCILAMNDESGDGILIDSNGYDYARYVSFLPNIKPYISQQISHAADLIIEDARCNTSNGSWNIDFEEITKQYGIIVKENNGLENLLLLELESRTETAEISAKEGSFNMVLYPDCCNNLEEKPVEQNMGM